MAVHPAPGGYASGVTNVQCTHPMTTTPLLAIVVTALVAQSALPTLDRRTFKTPDGSTVRYGLAVPG